MYIYFYTSAFTFIRAGKYMFTKPVIKTPKENSVGGTVPVASLLNVNFVFYLWTDIWTCIKMTDH